MRFILFLLSFNFVLMADVDLVQRYYDSAEYEKAIIEAKSSKADYSNPKLHFLWARSAELLGREEEAMSAYERVELLDETNIEARISLVKIYKNSGRDDLAIRGAKKLLEYDLTKQQRDVLNDLKSVDLHSFKYYAGIALGHDSNINVSPGELENIANVSDEISTMFSRFTGSVTYTNELEDKGSWYARGGLQIYNQSNFETQAKLYDLFLGAFSGGIGYGAQGYDIYIPLSYERVDYLDKQLLTQLKLEPNANIILNNYLILNGYLSYTSRSFSQSEDKIRDDNSFSIGGGIYYLFSKNHAYFTFKYENYAKKDDNSIALYIDKTHFSANGGVNYNLTTSLSTKFDYRLRLASYEDNEREDFYNQVELKLSYYFYNRFESYISNRYIDNVSNIDILEYNKNIFMLGLALNY